MTDMATHLEQSRLDDDQIMIRTIDLRVDYQDLTAVYDLNLEIPKGVVYGLIGPNGAGKSSTIRVLAALQQPTYGEVYIDGIDALDTPRKAHGVIGYMPDMPPVYESLKVWEYLDLYAGMYQLKHETRSEIIELNLNRVSLWEKRNAKAGELSRGMTQRLVLAKTLMHDPKVLLLDEPASGLDPMARMELGVLLRGLADEGKTILISSHILAELSQMCSVVGVMQKGRMILHGDMETIAREFRQHKRLKIDLINAISEERLMALNALEEIDQVNYDPETLSMTIDFMGDKAAIHELLKSMIQDGDPVIGFYEDKMTLEDVMIELGANQVS